MGKWIVVVFLITCVIIGWIFLKTRKDYLQGKQIKTFLSEMTEQAQQPADAPFTEYEKLYLSLICKIDGLRCDGAFESLPKPVQSLYIVALLDMEVQNGGLCQFFVNGGAEGASKVADGLREIGLSGMANVYECFVTDHGIDLAELKAFHVETAEQFSALYHLYPFDEFDGEYMKMRRQLKFERVMLNYANAHLEAFRS